MKLPTLPSFGKKEKVEYFLALLLGEERTTAVIFEEVNGAVRVVGEHEERFRTSIESLSSEELLEVLDKTISFAEDKLPNNTENRKTIFGVKESWVEDAKIKKEYLTTLKKLSDTLGLSPIGFLVIHEAVAHLLQEDEGAPVSGILIEVDHQEMALSLLRASRVAETKRTKIEDSIAKTTDRMLHHFTEYEVLPSRIIVLNSRDPEKISQELITHHWSKALPFLHVPQITILDKGYDARALLFGAATQMGFSVLDTQPVKQSETLIPDDEEVVPHKHPEETKEKESAIPTEVDAEALGFVANQDVAKGTESKKIDEEIPEDDEQEHEEHEEKDEEEQDHSEHTTPVTAFANEFFAFEHDPTAPKHTTPVQPPHEPVINDHHKRGGIKEKISGLFARLPLKNFHFPTLKLNFPGGGNKKLLFVLPLLLIVAIGLIVLYIFGVGATVNLHIAPKVVEQTETITFASGGQTDPSKQTVAAEVVSTSQNGSVSTDATGTKEIGDKAKGSVTLYSRFTQEKTYPAGTVITSSNNLAFTFDDSVKVASASGDASASPATAKVNVTAKDIGKESNLPSGTKFSLDSFDTSDIVAKNDNAFAGGSKKEITVVAKADLDKLLAELPKNLQDKANQDLSNKLSSDQDALPSFTDVEVTEKSFNKKTGDEASSVTLTGTVTYKDIVYKKSDMTTLAQALINDKETDLIPIPNGITYEIKDVKEKQDDRTAKVKIKASLQPKLDAKNLSDEISGKSFDEATDILKKMPQVADVVITLKPPIPFLPHILPRMAKNITIVTKANE